MTTAVRVLLLAMMETILTPMVCAMLEMMTLMMMGSNDNDSDDKIQMYVATQMATHLTTSAVLMTLTMMA